MAIIQGSSRFEKRGTHRLRNIYIAVAILGSLLCLDQVSAAENVLDNRATLRVPVTDSKPVVDGKLEEPYWQDAAKIGPIEITRGKREKPSKSSTEAFILRDADHLYVGVSRAGKDVVKDAVKDTAKGAAEPDKPAKTAEYIELLIDSNNDRNSYYLIRITLEDGGKATSSYNEHEPPWHDRTWQPRFEFAATKGAGKDMNVETAVKTGAWAVEFALPLNIFNKNRTLASTIGFNIRHVSNVGTTSEETHCWQGTFMNPGEGGLLTGIPTRDRLPVPDDAPLWLSRPPTKALVSSLANRKERTIRLGPGSTHPGTTGEVKLELEGFLMAGGPHARGIIWDLAVDQRQGELYVLSDTRPVKGVPEIRVFNRRGEYLRTIMPLNPTLPRSSVRDLCRKTVWEGETELIVPKLFETAGGVLCMYGPRWNLPQKMALAPDGDLVLSNIHRGTLWRMKPDGGLPERWTSAYHRGRNEPFESTGWTQHQWNIQDLKNYMPFHSLHYPYFCFDPAGLLYVSAGQSSRPTKQYGYYWEVGEQRKDYYHWETNGNEGRGDHVWKCRMHSDVKVEPQNAFGGFAEPSGLVLDGNHLIVADAGNNRLQVLEADGRPAASITHYLHEGKKEPLNAPTALAIDREKNLYVLVAPEPRPKDPRVERTLSLLRQATVAAAKQPPEPPKRLIKLKSWQQPELLAVSRPVHQDVLQIAVDAGVSPPLVWVANGIGPGSLVQLAGGDLSVNQEWMDRGESLSCPRQSGNQPILNIDPRTGDLYVEDDSNYRLKQYGTVYRLDQAGTVLEKWPPLFFDERNLEMTSPWGTLDYERHFRYPKEPLFIDSIFGKDGRVYRWKSGKAGVEILRFDREGTPIPFKTTGTNALFVDHLMQTNFWHDVYHGMDVDSQGNIYYVAKVDVDPKSRPVSPYRRMHRQINVYDADGNLKKRGMLRLDCVRGIQVDNEGNLYILHRPADRPREVYLALSKFPPSGGDPLWSRPWDGYLGQAEVTFAPCHCTTSRQHQTLDQKGYLYAAAKYGVQVIDCETGKLVGQFGSYGNMDCQGKGSRFPHPELPFGTVSALAVWKDRLFVVDELNRRIVKCRIVYDKR